MKWRRERDSNPRKDYSFTGLANLRFRPLSHLSTISALWASGTYFIRAKVNGKLIRETWPLRFRDERNLCLVCRIGINLVGRESPQYRLHVAIRKCNVTFFAVSAGDYVARRTEASVINHAPADGRTFRAKQSGSLRSLLFGKHDLAGTIPDG